MITAITVDRRLPATDTTTPPGMTPGASCAVRRAVSRRGRARRRRLGGELLVLHVEEDPHHGRPGEHHEDADQEGVRGAGREAADVGQRPDQLRRRASGGAWSSSCCTTLGSSWETPRPMAGAIDEIWALV